MLETVRSHFKGTNFTLALQKWFTLDFTWNDKTIKYRSCNKNRQAKIHTRTSRCRVIGECAWPGIHHKTAGQSNNWSVPRWKKKARFSATAFCCFVPILPVAVVLEFHTSLLQRLCRIRAFPNSMVFKGFGMQIGYLFLATLVMHKARAPDKTCFFPLHSWIGYALFKRSYFFIVIVKLRPSTKALLRVRQLCNCHQLGMEFLVRSSIE